MKQIKNRWENNMKQIIVNWWKNNMKQIIALGVFYHKTSYAWK